MLHYALSVDSKIDDLGIDDLELL